MPEARDQEGARQFSMSVVSKFFRQWAPVSRPNNLVIHERRLVLMLIAKVANTSVKTAVLGALGIHGAEVHKIGRTIYPVPSRREAMRLRRKGYTVVSVVRNPLDRFTSCWAQKIARPCGTVHKPIQKLYGDRVWHAMPIEEWASFVATVPDRKAEIHFRSMSYDLVTPRGQIIPTDIFRLEDRDWWTSLRSLLIDRCDLDIGPEQRKNPKPIEPPPLSERARGLVAARYGDDFWNFRYDVSGTTE